MTVQVPAHPVRFVPHRRALTALLAAVGLVAITAVAALVAPILIPATTTSVSSPQVVFPGKAADDVLVQGPATPRPARPDQPYEHGEGSGRGTVIPR